MAFNTGEGTLALSIPITKATDAGDGTVFVEGLCTDDGIDLDDQIIDREFAAKGLETWFSEYANVRQMHAGSLPPAGKAVAMEKRADGIWIRTHVVEPTAVKLVKAGVYQAYSVGISKPRIIRDGIAKNGRVIDGVFSEISLVDFPANPRSRFQLAKRASNGELEVVEKAFGPELTKVPTPRDLFDKGEVINKSGTEEIVATNEGKAADADLTKAGAKDCTNCGEQHDADSKAKFCGNCGHKLPGGKSDKAEDADLEKGGLANLGDKKAKPFGKKDDDGDDDGDDGDDNAEDNADDAKKSAAPLYVARLHAATCAAFHEEDVLAVHPALAKGIPSLVDPAPWAEAVTKALTEDSGSGTRAGELPALSEAYALAVELQKADPKLLEAAMDDLRKSFADANPGAHPTPSSITPGQFKRPYISAGRISLSAKPGQKPRVPLKPNTPTAADFRRGPLTAGHERVAPGSKAADPDLVKAGYQPAPYDADGEGKGEPVTCPKCGKGDARDAKFCDQCGFHLQGASGVKVSKGIGDVLREQAAGVLTAMHDHIAAQHPGICPMGADTAEGAEKAADAATTAVEADVAKGFDPELIKSYLAPALTALREGMEKDWNETREALEKRITELEKSPDPTDRAYRGAPLAALRGPQAQDAAGSVANDGAAEALRSVILKARNPNTGISRPAMDQLIKLVGPQQAADLVG